MDLKSLLKSLDMNEIKLFNIPNYTIHTTEFSNLLHDEIVVEVEQLIADYVGAKYACSVNSATSAIFLAFVGKKITVNVPSVIPPVVLNAILTSGNKINFVDNIEWVGGSYILHDFKNYKIIDSAQKIEKNQFKQEANPNDLMIFSFYPTKPIGGCDGGMIVSDDYEKIKWFKEASLNGMSFAENNWERQIIFPGWKMYMNSIQAFFVKQNFLRLADKYQRLDYIQSKYNTAFRMNNKSHHLYRVNVENRERVIEKLKVANISYGIHYDAQHMNLVYTKNKIDLPKSFNEANTTLSIPFNERLTEKELDLIIGEITYE